MRHDRTRHLLFDAGTVVLHEEEVAGARARQRIAVEVFGGGSVDVSGDVDIVARICCGGGAEGNRIRARAHLLGVELDAGSVVLGKEEVLAARQRIAVEAAVGISGEVDISVRVGRGGGARGRCPRRAQLLGVKLDAGGVVLGEKEVFGARQRIAVQAAEGKSGNIDVAVRIGRSGGGLGVHARPRTHLLGIKLDAGGVILGEKEVDTARRRIAVQAAEGDSGNINVTVRIGRSGIGIDYP